MPEQRIQRKQPRFQLAHRGSFFLQSTHTLLSGDLTSARRILALASVCARDWVTRDMVFGQMCDSSGRKASGEVCELRFEICLVRRKDAVVGKTVVKRSKVSVDEESRRRAGRAFF